MPDEKEYKVTLYFSEGTRPPEVFTVMAADEADAINKSKSDLSLNRDGDDYQLIQGASAILQ